LTQTNHFRVEIRLLTSYVSLTNIDNLNAKKITGN